MPGWGTAAVPAPAPLRATWSSRGVVERQRPGFQLRPRVRFASSKSVGTSGDSRAVPLKSPEEPAGDLTAVGFVISAVNAAQVLLFEADLQREHGAGLDEED